MHTDLTPCPSTLRSSEMRCPSVLNTDIHLTPKGALPHENENFQNSKEWLLNTPTLPPTELGFACKLEGETEVGVEIPSIKESILTSLDPNKGLRNLEENSHAEDTPKTIRVAVETPFLVQDYAPNHSSKLNLSRDECILATPPVSPSAQTHHANEDGDAASNCERVGPPIGSPVDKQRDTAADLTKQISSEVSATTAETENASTEQIGFCPTAEELNFFRYFVRCQRHQLMGH
jgi:hypothetical protein